MFLIWLCFCYLSFFLVTTRRKDPVSGVHRKVCLMMEAEPAYKTQCFIHITNNVTNKIMQKVQNKGSNSEYHTPISKSHRTK